MRPPSRSTSPGTISIRRCSTTPWQLDGVIATLLEDGYCEGQPVRLSQPDGRGQRPARRDGQQTEAGRSRTSTVCATSTCTSKDEEWIRYTPKAKMLVLDQVYPEGIRIPKRLIGSNIIHLPTMKTHVFTQMTGAMKNAFGGLLFEKRHWTHSVIHETLVDLLAIQKEIHPGHLRGDGRHVRRRRARPALHGAARQELHSGQRRHGRHRRGGREDDGLRSAFHQVHPPGARAGAWAAAMCARSRSSARISRTSTFTFTSAIPSPAAARR